jgi:hypothetical protein
MDDGALSGCLLDIFCEGAALCKLRAALKTQQNQPHAPQPTAVLLSGHRLLCLAIVCSVSLILCRHQPSLRFHTRRQSGLRSWRLSL